MDFLTNTLKYFMNSEHVNRKEQLIFYDFETTGLNPFTSKIIEYAFMKSEDDFISSLVDPQTKFEFKITQITGIYPDDIVDKPTILKKMEEILRYILEENTDTYLVAHNNDGFDKWFLKCILNDYTDIEFSRFKYIDTLILAKMLIPTLRSFSMKTLCQHFDIELSAHRAYNDTNALRQVYDRLLEILSDRMFVSVEELKKNPSIVYDYIYG